MNDYLQQLGLKRTSTWCRHPFANTIGNGDMRLLVEEHQLAFVAFEQRSLLAMNNGEPMF